MNTTTRTPVRSRATALAAAAVAATMAASATAPQVQASTSDLVGVIVREAEGAGDLPERLVGQLGGVVERQLPIIGGFAADLPMSAIQRLAASEEIVGITPDGQVRLNQTFDLKVEDTSITATVSGTETTLDGTKVLTTAEPVLRDVVTDLLRVDPRLPGAPANVAAAINADDLWAKGITGKGIDVAVIDSGVVPVDGLNARGKVQNGPDFSFEGGSSNVRHLDTYGHGTHMAGTIAGLANGASLTGAKDPNAYRGIAPGARIINVKVADATGATDVSQVIAAIDWVVQNRNTEGRNIRVLNLSFGTDGTQPYSIDPLAYAAEVAWRNGIVVVASGGNQGSETGRLMNPAIHPAIIAVGAADTNGTVDPSDDDVPAWSQRGSKDRHVDVTAPGRSVVSLRSPGSWIDANHTQGRVGAQLFKGSGTSQAAAVTSGAAALLLEHRPYMTPTQVKYVLEQTATKNGRFTNLDQGRGMIDVYGASKYNAYKRAKTDRSTSDGTGSLDAARGTMKVVADDGSVLAGEVTATGSTWSAGTWAGSTWSGSQWNGSTWSGSTWSGSTWSGSTWSGSTWSGSTWSGSTWSGSTWSGSTWSGSTWSGSTWSSTAFWSGVRWE